MWKTGHFLRFCCDSCLDAVRLLERFPIEFQQRLSRCQLAEQTRFGGRVQERVGSQQDGGVGQQSHAPSQPQTVEEHLVQAQLIFLVRLCGFNPRTHALQQLLRWLTGQRQQAKQRLMLVRSESKFARTLGSFPAARAEGRTCGDTKPVPIFSRRVPQPLQPLALATLDRIPHHVRWHQLHIAAEFGQHGHLPLLPTIGFGLRRQVAHVGHDDLGPPRPALRAITQTRHQQAAFGHIGWSHPTDQRYQQDAGGVRTPPQSQGVLLVTDKPTALPGFERAATQRRLSCGIGLGFFFLKPLQAASKSVASINANGCSQPAACSTRGWSNVSLMARSPETPTRPRNSCSMRASGKRCRCGKWAKARQARCSASKFSNRLSECTGVSTVSKCTRQSCAALKVRCGPRADRMFQRVLMKSSGMYGSSSVNNWEVPVGGSCGFTNGEPTHWNSLRPRKVVHNIS